MSSNFIFWSTHISDYIKLRKDGICMVYVYTVMVLNSHFSISQIPFIVEALK